MKCMRRVMSSLVAVLMLTNVAFGWTVTVTNGVHYIERTGMLEDKPVYLRANKAAGATFVVEEGDITLNQYGNKGIYADFIMPSENVKINITTVPVNKPIIGDGLIPVNWNEENDEWVDTTESSWEWDYSDIAGEQAPDDPEGNGVGKWANARTADGSLYVWIPRFTYKIISGENETVKSWNSDLIDGNETTVGKIAIKLSNGTTDDLTDDYIAHPAFEFNGKQISGFWIAKHEASRNDATDTAQGSGTMAVSSPGVKSWTGLTVSDAFTAAYNVNRTLESHLIRNSEWGAVAYLTNAIGRTPYNNNHPNILTGYSGDVQNATASETTATYFNTNPGGARGSTTHNVHGVYDMAGGATEMVAAYFDGSENLTTVGSSLVNADAIYKDIYNGATTTGDALYETSGDSGTWDSGNAIMLANTTPFLTRGSAIGADGSLYAFEAVTGTASETIGFRVALISDEGTETEEDGPNPPVLAAGMVPLNWNGTEWVDTTEEQWIYNYKSVAALVSNGTNGDGTGQWANARLADGSIFVWIPRYSYKIISGKNKNVITWNSDEVNGTETELGEIDIRWSKGIEDVTTDGYIVHPAFNYAQYLGGDTSVTTNYDIDGNGTPLTDDYKLEGFWVAKYEASRSDAIVAGNERMLTVNTSTGLATSRLETSGDMVEVTTDSLEGYKFLSWTAEGVVILDPTQPTINFMMPDNDVVLTANFRKSSAGRVTVNFEPNGGILTQNSKSVEVGGHYGILPEPTKEGSVFGGWYADEGLTIPVTSTTTVSNTLEHSLYAAWTISGEGT